MLGRSGCHTADRTGDHSSPLRLDEGGLAAAETKVPGSARCRHTQYGRYARSLPGYGRCCRDRDHCLTACDEKRHSLGEEARSGPCF